MKNIHILPTLQESEYFINKQGILSKSYSLKRNRAVYFYITSDEEIKDGDWVIWIGKDNQSFLKKVIDERDGEWLLSSTYDMWVEKDKTKKIILTTDQDLIKDGVQPIPDKFLGWFVKNPSCGNVEVEEMKCTGQCWKFIESDYEDTCTSGCELKGEYKIIIPKEESKQIYYNTVGRENGVNVIKGQFNTQKEALDLANELNEKGLGVYYDWRETLIKEEPKQECKGSFKDCFKPLDECVCHTMKQESLEEDKHYLDSYGCTKSEFELSLKFKRETIEEATERFAKRTYTKKDMIEASKYGYNFHKTTQFPEQDFEDSCIRNTQQWLTQFKNK